MKTFIFDMDDVLVDFFGEPNAIHKYHERVSGLFLKLKPNERVVEALNTLLEIGHSVKILSVAGTTEYIDEKFEWLAKYIPNLNLSDAHFVDHGIKKQEFVAEFPRGAILIDDHVLNCEQWVAKGGRAYIYSGGTFNPNRTALEHKTIPVVMDIYDILKEEL